MKSTIRSVIWQLEPVCGIKAKEFILQFVLPGAYFPFLTFSNTVMIFKTQGNSADDIAQVNIQLTTED